MESEDSKLPMELTVTRPCPRLRVVDPALLCSEPLSLVFHLV